MKNLGNISAKYRIYVLASCMFFLLLYGSRPSFAYNPTVNISGIVDDSITKNYRNYQLKEIVIKPKKEKYLKKNNLAIELIEKVIANKDKNRIENSFSRQFKQYEKFTLSVSNLDNAVKTKKGSSGKIRFPEYLSVSELDSSSIITVSIKEVVSDEYRNRKSKKSIIRAVKRDGIDYRMEIESLDAIYSEAFFTEINIFDNDLEILMKHFVSPLSSSLATSFYKYYILDTITYKNEQCILLDFAPYNVQDFGFTGRLWILPDNSWAVKKIELNIPVDNTVNFVKQMRVAQEFELLPSGLWAKSGESIIVNFEAYKFAPGVYAKKSINYTDYIINSVPDSIFKLEGNIVEREDAFVQPDSVWNTYRTVPLPENEQNVGELLDKMMKVSFFDIYMKVLKVLAIGYAKTNIFKDKSVFDIGPVTTFISGNPLEGVRFRLGGMTTANLNPHLFWNGYLAYGTKDNIFKYSSTFTYAFNKKKYHENEYRKNNLSFAYSYDVNTPGVMYSYIDKDNVLLSMRRGNNDLMTYLRQALAGYEYENNGGFSFKIWTNIQNEQAAGSLRFLVKDDAGNTTNVNDYTNSTVGIRLRYVRNEKIFQNRSNRFYFYRNEPVFGLTYTAGIKGYLNGEYNYHALEASAEKRFWFSAYGDVDVAAKAGKIWGELPFPLLMIPNTNQAYFLQPESFSLMNVLEFVNDEYALLDLQFHFNGLLFNRIPLLRRLKLREVAGFTGIYGKLSDRNDPAQNPALFLFPEGAGKMTDMPYMEASIGVENIFKVLRIYYVRRLSSLENPGISKEGIRFAFTFTF